MCEANGAPWRPASAREIGRASTRLRIPPQRMRGGRAGSNTIRRWNAHQLLPSGTEAPQHIARSLGSPMMNLQTNAPDCANGTRNLAEGSSTASTSSIRGIRNTWFIRDRLVRDREALTLRIVKMATYLLPRSRGGLEPGATQYAETLPILRDTWTGPGKRMS